MPLLAGLRPAACALLLLLHAKQAAARPEYVERIPNGANVPGIAALGHINNIGGGSINTFGEAFAAAGHVWTKALCEKDSDGDGQSNGAELGDPCCEWVFKTSQRLDRVDGVSSPADATKMSDPARWAKINCTASTGPSVTTPSTTAKASKVPTPALASSATGTAVAMLTATMCATALLL